jgi:hypothetical protein
MNKLIREWNQKLKESGFKDIEYKGKLKGGIDWRNYKGKDIDTTKQNLSRKWQEYNEYLWVLGVNAYNNKKIPFQMRRLIMRQIDTLGNKDAHREFRKSLPTNGLAFYVYLQRNREMMLSFARQFNVEKESNSVE